MLMSHSARSASLTGLPSPGRSAASAIIAPSVSARGTTAIKLLRINMLDLPFVVDGPARNDVHVPHRKRRHGHVHLRSAAHGEHLVARRLPVAGFVPGAALQDDRLAVPAPGHPEAVYCLARYWFVERRFTPALAAIGRNHDF